MSLMNDFVSRTLKPFLIVFGLTTCGTLPFAIDIDHAVAWRARGLHAFKRTMIQCAEQAID